jgi:alkaline phosphatase D
LTRRRILAGTLGWGAVPLLSAVPLEPSTAADSVDTRQAMGVKVGEVTDTSAIVWMRLTARPTRNQSGIMIEGDFDPKKSRPLTVATDRLEGSCPGAAGRVRVRYGTREDLSDARETDWADVSDGTDFSHQHRLARLKPGTVYYFAAETTGPGGTPVHGAFRGHFETAPAPDQRTDLRFCVLTCQLYAHLDHLDGFNIYQAMADLDPKFVVFTGDNVYYDRDEPRAVTVELARYHWERMYSVPRHIELLRNVASYWEKDDHDTLDNDSWPTPSRHMGDLRFTQGQEIFRRQVPMSGSIYRTFRWGRDLQIWLTDGRDFRSPNTMPDGPDKTIWGEEQKAWLKRTLGESDATWKVVISPTPIVGPDRGGKNDNHANTGFSHEGDEIRAWFRQNVPDNLFVICGDRHWQYHSVHPRTGLNEFSVGPASDAHAEGSPGPDKRYHRFHRLKGGFLSVDLLDRAGKSSIRFRHRDVRGAVVYEWETGPRPSGA